MTSPAPFSYDIDQVKGFLDPDEGQALYDECFARAGLGPVLEIGSYCGKSTIYLGKAAEQQSGLVYALDHHRGSEEHQKGEGYHDAELYDADLGVMDTLPYFRRAIFKAGLEKTVLPVVGDSAMAGRYWQTPLSMLFIDGGHSMEQALTDWQVWSRHVMAGGTLAIHDIFENPEEGGRPPYEIYKLALGSGLFELKARVKTLGLLTRLG